MGFLAVINAYTMRVCLSVAITEMVLKKTHNATDDTEQCQPQDGDGSSSTTGGSFDWSEAQQGVILSSFFWGYVITHVPGGLLAERFGGKYVLCLGILSTAIFTLITPIVVDNGEFLFWSINLLQKTL